MGELTDYEFIARVMREYQPADAEACRQLLCAWEATQGRKHCKLLDHGYTLACFELAHQLPDDDLRGQVVLLDGQIAAFAFGGEMWPGMASFFIAKASACPRGLSYFLRWHFAAALQDYGLVNDASDLGHPGLRQFKRSLRPVAMVDVYTAEQRRHWTPRGVLA